MGNKRIDYEHQVTVCINEKTGVPRYSLRNQGYLFWTGLEDDRWIAESVHGTDGGFIFECPDKELIYALKSILEYSLVKRFPMDLILKMI